MRRTTVDSHAVLEATPEQVFEFVTTAGNWPRWHPSSIAVRGQSTRPGEVGDVIEEDFRVAGRTGTVVWTVTERTPPRSWTIDGVIVGRTMGGRVSYALTPADGATSFERRFSYPVPLRYLPLDILIVARRVRKESDRAVRNLAKEISAQFQPRT